MHRNSSAAAFQSWTTNVLLAQRLLEQQLEDLVEWPFRRIACRGANCPTLSPQNNNTATGRRPSTQILTRRIPLCPSSFVESRLDH